MSSARKASKAKAKNLKGTRLGRYTLVEHLATGGMAEIFLAHHKAEGAFRKELVLKVLQPRWAEHQAVVEMFIGEARIAAGLSHPNIVDVYDVATEDGTHYMVMEYIRGKTLTELARRAIEVSQYLPLDVGVHIVAEIASALAYMNEALDENGQAMQIVHRDVSPTNVIIGSSGQVKLIDFGIARQGSAVKEESGVRPGKASYMSPEQAQGVALDGRSDLFSLGTILYEITVGRRLWRGSKEDSIRRIVEEKPVPPTFVLREYPSDLEMIVMRTLEKRPEDRYQSAREFADDLQLFLQASGALMRSHHQMARYLRDLFSPASEAQITEDGLRSARIFAEGDEDGQQGDEEPLDFDQPASGPGAALARALRSAGPAIGTAAAPSSPAPDEVSDEVPHLSVPDEVPGVSVPAAADQELVTDGSDASLTSPADEASALEVPPAAEPVPNPGQTPIVVRAVRGKKAAENRDKVPRTLPLGAILFVSVLLAAATAGVVWLLRGG